MKIQVTREHIDQGEIAASECCAVALAIKPFLKPGVNLQVDESLIHLGSPVDELWGYENIEPPGYVSDFIKEFDALSKDDDRAVLSPFEFDLDIPQEFLKPTEVPL